MASDHVRRGHEPGKDAECPGCRETCYCASFDDAGDRPCVHCFLVMLGLKP